MSINIGLYQDQDQSWNLEIEESPPPPTIGGNWSMSLDKRIGETDVVVTVEGSRGGLKARFRIPSVAFLLSMEHIIDEVKSRNRVKLGASPIGFVDL